MKGHINTTQGHTAASKVVLEVGLLGMVFSAYVSQAVTVK
jgi:hypothetical protein